MNVSLDDVCTPSTTPSIRASTGAAAPHQFDHANDPPPIDAASGPSPGGIDVHWVAQRSVTVDGSPVTASGAPPAPSRVTVSVCEVNAQPPLVPPLYGRVPSTTGRMSTETPSRSGSVSA